MNLGELLKGGQGVIKETKLSNRTSDVKTITDPLLLKWMDNIMETRNENKT